MHTGERAYRAVGTDHYCAVLGALAAGDLFHDGRIDVVADDDCGNVDQLATRSGILEVQPQARNRVDHRAERGRYPKLREVGRLGADEQAQQPALRAWPLVAEPQLNARRDVVGQQPQDGPVFQQQVGDAGQQLVALTLRRRIISPRPRQQIRERRPIRLDHGRQQLTLRPEVMEHPCSRQAYLGADLLQGGDAVSARAERRQRGPGDGAAYLLSPVVHLGAPRSYGLRAPYRR